METLLRKIKYLNQKYIFVSAEYISCVIVCKIQWNEAMKWSISWCTCIVKSYFIFDVWPAKHSSQSSRHYMLYWWLISHVITQVNFRSFCLRIISVLEKYFYNRNNYVVIQNDVFSSTLKLCCKRRISFKKILCEESCAYL